MQFFALFRAIEAPRHEVTAPAFMEQIESRCSIMPPEVPMHFFSPPLPDSSTLEALHRAYRCDESAQVKRLLIATEQHPAVLERIQVKARQLVETVRLRRRDGNGIDALMHEYQLSTPEGVVLMCLAEALLRIPDEATADSLIRDKLAAEDWEKHLGNSESLFVNASTFGLMVAGRMIRADKLLGNRGHSILSALLQRSGEPLIRNMLRHAMRILANQFVMGRNIEAALDRARENEAKGFLHSYDMLGEAARTQADSERYLQAYLHAIAAIGNVAKHGPLRAPGISIKLSALHPRFEYAQGERVMKELYPRLLQLAEAARDADIGLTIDAEETERFEPSLMLLQELLRSDGLREWQGLGLAVQAYQKRAYDFVAWLGEQAAANERRLMVRLVKGAYWDTEIKIAQERGLDDYPVFTRKAATDLSYLACAKELLAQPAHFYPQFATHNAHTAAAVLELASAAGIHDDGMEFQRLHGMGAPLHEQLLSETGIPCRIYSPVGSHEELLPYLVRRLLENGANSSFVNRIADDQTPIEHIIADPRTVLAATDSLPNPRIPLPRHLYQHRVNSRGLDLCDTHALQNLQSSISETSATAWHATPLVMESTQAGKTDAVTNPTDRRAVVGHVTRSTSDDIERALAQGLAAFASWNATEVDTRAAYLERASDLLEARMPAFIALCQAEAGKTLADAVNEVREAIDFCRYYAERARSDFAPRALPGPTGESNQLTREGRGVFACISPWNFPLSIFIGQIAAALAGGNCVIAKPAAQTPLIAAQAIQLLHEAGIPKDVLQLLPGSGEHVGAALVSDPRIAGVAFTGGIDTAWAINRTLAARAAPIATFIAETGGLNAMLVDSSALPEQVTSDVLSSAFQSAGQRCSALRLLLVQEEVAPTLILMIAGAMAELVIGDPASLATDIGPVIDNDSLARLQEHAQRMEAEATCLYRCTLPAGLDHGTFFPPMAFELNSLNQLPGEVFGPILHVLRYRASELDALLDALNARGYGLTFGIQSRIDSTVEHASKRIRAGNIYVNRNIIGAVVGVHPFGGMGLSGTGPKAGGPDYLRTFTVEKTVSINTTAAGGNASLMTLGED
jgi:RHH-type proline utilization regulon transcriptional repressor/proline dehydrogenase/delta 1-pyrroline-5-carboxylate dehydrogenase